MADFLLVADLGIDQVKIYRFDGEKGTLSLVDAIRCDLESGPRHFMFSKDGKFLYLMYEIKNVIDVYTYETGDRVPKIEKIQTIPSTAPERTSQLTAACTIRMSEDETHLFCSNAAIIRQCLRARCTDGAFEAALLSADQWRLPEGYCDFPGWKPSGVDQPRQ